MNPNNRAKIAKDSAKAITKIINDLIFASACGFLPNEIKAALPISPIPIAGPKTPNPTTIAMANSLPV